MHKNLTDIEPSQLQNQELLAYTLKVIDHFRFAAFNHHRFNSAAMLPVNFFLRFSIDNGISEVDAYELLEGKLKEQVYAHSSGRLRKAFLNPKNKIALDALEKAVQISDDNSMVKKDKDDMILNILNALQYDLAIP